MMHLEPGQLAAISRLFSSGVIREMARKGRSPLFVRLATQTPLLDSLSASQCVHRLFDAAFSILTRQGHRDEYIYKAALIQRVLFGKHSLQTASILNEFRVGDCKADLAILNGTATVYEVKSERDSLARLEKQIAAYMTVFASVNVIAGENHVDAVLSSVPKDVGVLRLDRRLYVSTIRDAAKRPDRTSPEAIFDSIRTLEARKILEAYGVGIPSVPNTELSAALRRLFRRLKPSDAHEGMVHILKKTRALMPLSSLVEQLPRSLHTAALYVPLRKSDHTRLVGAVNTRLKDAMAWA